MRPRYDAFASHDLREVCRVYVCLCVGATSQAVAEAVERGASTSNAITAACGAGGDCGLCRRTLRAIIARTLEPAP